MIRLAPLLLVLGALLLSCCSDPRQDAAPESDDDTVELSHMNKPLPGITTAGQLTEAQFDALVKQGVRNFVSLRQADEKGCGWEEARAAEAGVRFVRIPVAGAKGINRENAVALDAALKESGGAETIVYCGSSNRVGALFAIRAHMLEGKSKEEALALGKAAGATRYVEVIERVLGIK